MKMRIAGCLLFIVTASLSQAQIVTSGLIPKTPTFYVNTNSANNYAAESHGVAIAANGNVLIGWEDDGTEIYDFEAAWTLFDGNGNMLTPPTVQTNRDLNAPLTTSQSITNTYLSFFRSDGTPTGAYLAWGPKIKANIFGNGLGMGAVGMTVGLEVPELFNVNMDAGGGGDFPVLQLLNNNGSPAGVALSGAGDADAEPAGDIRIADWDYLSNGNIVIAGESRQVDDRTRFSVPSGNIPTYRIVTPTGVEVKGYSAVSSSGAGASMWHGIGVTANGFAVRFDQSGAKVRLFDNAGNPTSADIDLATVAGHPEAGGGSRGDGAGFHGNGKDAYLHVCTRSGVLWATVLNADGTLRWSRAVADPVEPFVANRVDGAIAPDGRVIAVWDSALPNATFDVTNLLVQARLFSATGQPLGGRFVVSEWENPANPATTNISEVPRVAWRNDTIAITWESANAPSVLADPLATSRSRVIAARLLNVISLPRVTITPTGGNITIGWTGGGTLQTAPEVIGPWTDIGDVNPLTIPKNEARKFFRVRAW